MLRQASHSAKPQVNFARHQLDIRASASPWPSLSTLAPWLSRAGDGVHRSHSLVCDCRKAIATRITCMLLPRHRFSTSLFNTPILLFLRLFYQASSYDFDSEHIQSLPFRELQGNEHWTRTPVPVASQQADRNVHSLTAFHRYEKISTTEWSKKLAAFPLLYENYRVVSLTWIKALGSPLSHEFIQFIVEDTTTGARSRLIADRYEDGDWVFEGWNWALKQEVSHRHSLPMPLVSITYNDSRSRPSIASFAQILADVTASRPAYSLMREMCWWYAEAVFDEVRSRFGGTLKEWRWARYRYSFVVRTNLLQRKVLAADAEEFRKRSLADMNF